MEQNHDTRKKLGLQVANLENKLFFKQNGGIMKKFYITAFLVILGMFLGNCENKKADSIEQDRVNLGLLVKIVTGASAAPSCTGSSTFSAVSAAGDSKCSGCHGTQGGYTFSASGSAAFVTAGKPESSKMYLTVSSGNMAPKSDATINSAIYCWIKDGAKP
jgi:hypothetical protein